MVMEPPSPQCVGREFVRQYYTLLNQAPLHLHRFYSHNSSFVHGGLEGGRDAEAVFGQQEIHQKIMTLNFRDCHAKIRQVDSHETLANGVVVQVSGELSNNGEPMRRFMQTFVLAPQSPKKYYVHNDIFRYQDEVFDDADNSVSSSGNVTASDNTAAETIREMKEMNAAAVLETGTKVSSEPERQHTNGSNNYEDNTNLAPPVEPMNVEEGGNNDWKPEPVLTSPVEVSAPVVEQWKSPEPELAQTNIGQQQQQDDEEVIEAGQPGDEDAAGGQSGNPDQPRTWSSMVKSGAAPGASKPPAGPKEGTPVFQGDRGGHQKPSGYARGQRGSSQGRSPGQRSERFSKDESDPRQSEMIKNGDSQQLFVGNLPHNCTEDDLSALFSKFGQVIEVRINQKQGGRDTNTRTGRDGKQTFVPNFGFVVFTEAESVDRALAAKPILLNGNHRLNVEEKKMRTGDKPPFSERDRDRDLGKRGSQDNLRGAGNFAGGRGGGDRGRGGGRGGGSRGRGDFSRGGGHGRGGLGPDNRGGYRGGGRGG